MHSFSNLSNSIKYKALIALQNKIILLMFPIDKINCYGFIITKDKTVLHTLSKSMLKNILEENCFEIIRSSENFIYYKLKYLSLKSFLQIVEYKCNANNRKRYF